MNNGRVLPELGECLDHEQGGTMTLFICWFTVWFIQTLIMFLVGVKLHSLSYNPEREPNRFIKLLFGDFDTDSELITITIFAMIPVINIIAGIIYGVVGMASGDFMYAKQGRTINPVLWVARKLFKRKYLIDEVAENV